MKLSGQCQSILDGYRNQKSIGLLSIDTLVYFFFSAILSAIGFMYDDYSVILGSMLISPVTDPIKESVLLYLSGDHEHVPEKLLGLVLFICMAIGFGIVAEQLNNYYLNFDIPTKTMLTLTDSRFLKVNFLIGFMFGIAISYSTLKGNYSAVIGLNLAVAIMPPLVNSGFFFSRYLNKLNDTTISKEDANIEYQRGFSSLMIALINILGICISLLIGFYIFC